MDEMLSEKNQRINELGEEVVNLRKALADIALTAKCGLEIGFREEALTHILKVAETGEVERE